MGGLDLSLVVKAAVGITGGGGATSGLCSAGTSRLPTSRGRSSLWIPVTAGVHKPWHIGHHLSVLWARPSLGILPPKKDF